MVMFKCFWSACNEDRLNIQNFFLSHFSSITALNIFVLFLPIQFW